MTDEYDFGAEEEEETEGALEESSSRRKEGVKPVSHHHHHLQQCQHHQNHHIAILPKKIITSLDLDQVKRLKSGRHLKSVRVRVEKLHGKRQVIIIIII